MADILSLNTAALNIHLNTGQDFNIDTSQVLMTLETKSSEFLSTQFTKQIGNGQVQLPNNFNSNLNTQTKISLRVSLSLILSINHR